MGLEEKLSSTRGRSVKMQPPSQAVFKGPFVSSEATLLLAQLLATPGQLSPGPLAGFHLFSLKL